MLQEAKELESRALWGGERVIGGGDWTQQGIPSQFMFGKINTGESRVPRR